MARKVDWLDYAHELAKEQQRLKDKLPAGMDVFITLYAFSCGTTEFVVYLSHKERDLKGSGRARTPAKAFEEAKADLAKQYAEQQRRPRIAAAKALPAGKPAAKVRGVLFEA